MTSTRSSCVIALALAACGPSAATRPSPRSPALVADADGGLPAPAPSSRHGIIVPSDTGLGSQPTGSGTSTGSNDRRLDPTLGGGQ